MYLISQMMVVVCVAVAHRAMIRRLSVCPSSLPSDLACKLPEDSPKMQVLALAKQLGWAVNLGISVVSGGSSCRPIKTFVNH
jgi:hypothetical protein